MHDPRTEPKFGLYVKQDDDAMWHWCFATQPRGELFHIEIGEDRFATADEAMEAGLRRRPPNNSR